MNYKIEIPKLAKTLGFESKMIHSKPYLYSTNEDLRWHLWKQEFIFWFCGSGFDLSTDEGLCNLLKKLVNK